MLMLVETGGAGLVKPSRAIFHLFSDILMPGMGKNLVGIRGQSSTVFFERKGVFARA